MGKMYEDWNETFCDELCTEIKCFEEKPTYETLKKVKDLVEVINGLQEMEMAGAIRRIAEDRYGYDSGTGRFRKMECGDGMFDPYERDMELEFLEMFNAARGGSSRGGRRRRDSRGRFVANMADPRRMSTSTHYPDMGDEDYPWGYPPYYPMMNDGMDVDGGKREYSGDKSSHPGSRKSGTGYGMDNDGMYMLRQQNGMPIMTPYNAHDPHDIPKKMTDQQYEEWMQDIENDDGTDGAKWTKQQIEAEAKKAGVDYSKVGLSALWACTNMMYSDYCSVAQKYNVDRPSFYIHLAHAFLNDEDFDGDGKEKLSIYYHTIAEHE